MSKLNRRDLLTGVAMVSASRAVQASVDGVQIKVAEILQEWRRRQRELTLSFVPDGRFSVDDPDVVELTTIAEGFSAVQAVHQLAAIPVEDQVHPRVQQAMRETAGAFGGALLRCRDMCLAFLDGAREDDFVQLHGALRVLRLSSSEWDLPPRRKRMLGAAFDLSEDPDDPQARRQLRAVVRRIDKLESLVERARQEGRAEDLLRPATRAQREGAELGLLRHGVRPQALEGSEPEVNLGLAMIGAVLVAGGTVLLVLGLCNVLCGDPGGILLILTGLALVGLGFWALSASWRRPPSAPKHRSELPEESGARLSRRSEQGAAPVARVDGLGVNVHVHEGWVDTSLRRSPDGPLRLRARGRVYGPWGWMASANGDGVAAGLHAPLPGAPELALLAEVGGKILFLGAEGEIPAGPPEPVRLCLNLSPGEATGALGFFHVAPA